MQNASIIYVIDYGPHNDRQSWCPDHVKIGQSLPLLKHGAGGPKYTAVARPAATGTPKRARAASSKKGSTSVSSSSAKKKSDSDNDSDDKDKDKDSDDSDKDTKKRKGAKKESKDAAEVIHVPPLIASATNKSSFVSLRVNRPHQPSVSVVV